MEKKTICICIEILKLLLTCEFKIKRKNSKSRSKGVSRFNYLLKIKKVHVLHILSGYIYS